MMCEYCSEKMKTLLNIKVHDIPWFGGDVLVTEKMYREDLSDRSVFIDRGYLRLVDPEDCSCMDNGEVLKINYCPMCGEKLEAKQPQGEEA